MKKDIDPLETYIVREVFCCGHGHSPGARFTHWESGEACICGHQRETSNEDVHLYWRLCLIPKWKGTKEDRYAADTEPYWDWLRRPEHTNKWCHFIMAPKGMHEGQEIGPLAMTT